jgi:hypothetical protein
MAIARKVLKATQYGRCTDNFANADKKQQKYDIKTGRYGYNTKNLAYGQEKALKQVKNRPKKTTQK